MIEKKYCDKLTYTKKINKEIFMENTNANPGKMNFLLGLFVGIAAVSVIGFLVMLGVVFNDGGSEATAGTEAPIIADNLPPTGDDQAEQPSAPVPAISNNDYVKGGANAKVVLIEYTDFECPFCLRHHNTMNQILAEYGDQVKYVLRHFPLSFHPNAQKAAEAAECAGEQGKFYEMCDALFKSNEDQTMGLEKFKAIAKELGLNTSTFNSCLDDGKYAEKINSEAAAGQMAGVDGTPATFINGQLVSGALPFENFKDIVDSLIE